MQFFLESDLENSFTEFYKDYVDIGLPKILKYKNKISLIASRFALEQSLKNEEVVYQTQKFFRLTLNEYLNGGIICQFCQKQTFNWNDPNVFVKNLFELKYIFFLN